MRAGHPEIVIFYATCIVPPKNKILRDRFTCYENGVRVFMKIHITAQSNPVTLIGLKLLVMPQSKVEDQWLLSR